MSTNDPANDPADDPASRAAAARRRVQLERVAASLRVLHKHLMDEARAEFERERGPVPSAAAFLGLLMGDPWFGWLRPLSAAMADLDALLDVEAPGPDHARRVRLRFEALVTDEGEGDFPGHYREDRQRSPDVVMAHAAVRLALRPL